MYTFPLPFAVLAKLFLTMMKFFFEKLDTPFCLVIYYVLVVVSSLLPSYNASGTYSAKNAGVPAVLVFGDSIVDPGNNNNLKTIAKSNFPPYGRDLMGGQPTGRFSNGKVPSDIIAEEVGLKELLPAYLDPSLQLQDLLTGVSFASGAAGYDPFTAQLAAVLSLSDQLDMFRDYVGKIKSALGDEGTANFVLKSVYVVCVGSNDISNTYPLRQSQYDINSYTDLMINSASSFFKELYGLGARRIAILSLPPTGCVPSQRTLRGGPNRECYEFINQAAVLFNSKLSSTVDSLNEVLPDARLVYGDIYYPLLSLIQNPAEFGFEVATKGCCGTGNIEVSVFCNRLEDKYTCKDASKYIFWDSFHPTEKAYKILVPIVLKQVLNKLF